MARLAAIWRHPVKSHGREALTAVALRAGETMPWDRVWAVAHEASKFDRESREWAPCQNFTLASKAPGLMAAFVITNEETGVLTITHPDREPLVVNPDKPGDADRLIAWSAGFVPQNRARPAFVARATRGMTDTGYPSVSIHSLASLRALSAAAGREISADRFRGNFWVEGWEPWAELDMAGKEISIGGVRLLVRERTRRCAATTANPLTGAIDFDTPAFLEATWGHRDFGVYAEVLTSGPVAVGDDVTLLT